MNIEGVVSNIFFRKDAEGNPMHKALSRDIAPNTIIPINKQGLDGSIEWHRDKQVTERKVLSTGGKSPEDRALLCQSVQNYNLLMERFPGQKGTLHSPNFAENVLIDGFFGQDVCIGDQFHVVRDVDGHCDTVVAVFQVVNPRRPCYKIKMKHTEELCMYTAAHGLAGWFFRVLEEGSISRGDRIVLHHRPHPTWNLYRISHLMYSECNLSYDIPRWIGTEEELREIIALPELGMFRLVILLSFF